MITINKLADLLSLPVKLAIYRYGHLYVVQGNFVTILDPSGSTSFVELDFPVHTWSSYGGNFCLYGKSGLVQFSGKDMMAYYSEPGKYSAPYGIPYRDSRPIVGEQPFPDVEINGAIAERRDCPDCYTRFLAFSYETVNKVTGVMVEPSTQIVFTNKAKGFAFVNGVEGNLLHSAPPDKVIPYNYPNGLVGGTKDGYVFSPDNGVSWRARSLLGFGVLTENALITCSSDQGITVVRGGW